MKKLLICFMALGASAAVANEYGEEPLFYDDYEYSDTYYAPAADVTAPAVNTYGGRRDNYFAFRIQKNESIAFDYDVHGGSDAKARKDNFGLNLMVGNRLTDFIKIEFETAYTGAKFAKRGTDFDFSIWSNTLNVYMFQEFGGAVAPYVGVGLGLAGIWSDATGIRPEADCDLTWQLMLGVNFALNERVDLNGGVKYQNYGKAEHDMKNGGKATTTIDATAFYLGAAYKFAL